MSSRPAATGPSRAGNSESIEERGRQASRLDPDSRKRLLDGLREAELEWRLAGRNLSKAEIARVRLPEADLAVKTYARRPAWIRHTIGRWQIRREAAVYRAAEGVPGLPAYIGRPDPFTLVTEWVEALPLPELGRIHAADRVFAEVEKTLAGLHDRGIAVADLHHRNVLVGGDGRVFVVDLAAGWVLGRRAGRIRRALVGHLQELDLLALTRMRARWTGGDVEQALIDHGGSIAAWHRRGRMIKRIVNRLRGKKR